MADNHGDNNNDREQPRTDLFGSDGSRNEAGNGAQQRSEHELSGMEDSRSLGGESAGRAEDAFGNAGGSRPIQSADEPVGSGNRSASEQPGSVPEHDGEAINGRNQNGSLNWKFTGVTAGGPKSKFKDNIAALRLLRQLQAEERQATHEEKQVLAKYVGWGGIPQAFDEKNPAWAHEYVELKELLTQLEYSEARSSTLNAHYTPPSVIDGVYTALKQFGVKEGANFLEPASGTGNFAGRNSLNPAHMYMVELDPTSAAISKHLYPENITIQSGFERFIPKPNFFDVALGNPPFGQYRLHDSRNPQLSRFSVHNYFIGKSIESVKPGGLTAMVVSRHFMDAKKSNARAYIAEKAHFLGAIRLPNSTFKENALTSVTTDLVFFQRKVADEDTNKDWVSAIEANAPGAEDTYTLNSYFAENPEQIIGQMRFRSSAHGPVIDCFADDNIDLKQAIEQRLGKLPSNIALDPTSMGRNEPEEKDYPTVNFEHSFIKVDSFFKVPDGRIAVRTADVMGVQTYRFHQSKSKTEELRISSAVDIRDTFYALINLEVDDADSTKIESTRATLNELYDKHVKKYGFLSSQVNKSVLRNDPSYSLLASLEVDYDKGVTKTVAQKEGKIAREPSARKAAILSKRVNQPRKRIESVETSKDALVVCLNEFGRVDLEYIAQLTRKDESTIIGELKGLVYQNPTNNEWETASKYLSGDVKKKLKIAEEAGDEFASNCHALSAVIPDDIDAVDIGIQLNSTWVPPQVIKDFINSELGLAKNNCYIDYQPAVGRWIVELEGGPQSLRNEKWGTEKLDANEIIVRLMMNSEIKVNKRVGENEHGQPLYRVDIEATLEAQSKADEIQNAFQDWVWRDPERRNMLARTYNDTMNTHVPVKYDGSHLTLPLASPEIKLRQHQKDAVWRAIQEGTGLFDHTVGAGKTFATVATVMEGRRMGTFKKPMITVPNGLLNQWKDEFYTLYPGANVLVADKSDFEKENRRTLFARIASGDWDAVIVGHSSFQFIGVNPEEERAFIDEQVEGIEEAIRNAKSNGGQRDLSIKQLERAKKTIQKKVEESSDAGRKDDLLTFEQLGVDALFVDEADTFKNLAIITAHSNIAGLGSTTPTQKCTDLFLKVRSLQKRNEGKGVYFLTGTPISNSIAELYTMQRYLQFDTLKEKNLLAFDAWASTFGQITSDWELDATGMNYRINNRFGKFNNVPELMRMYRTFADVVTQKDLARQAVEDGTGRLVPKIAGGKPQNVICERSPLQEQYMGVEIPFRDEEGRPVLDAVGRPMTHWNSGSIIDRMVNRREGDNALNVTMDARLAALDFRIIDPNVPDWEKSKINAAAERIYSIWEKNDHRRGTQLVFCDLSTPKGRSSSVLTAANAEDDTEDAHDISMSDILMRRRQPSTFSAYEELFRKLVDMGMPAEQIRFIQDAKNEAQQQELYNQVNSGEVRVLVGSTTKMGAGVNVQKRLVAQHHLDCPWRPRDMEQRDGRIIRQGNLFFAEDRDNFEVEIYRYATEKTYDARMWQTIEVKARAIEQFRNGTLEDRTIEDVAGEAASAAEMKAAATGNPLMFMQVQIDANKRKAETRYRSWQRVQHAQQARRTELPGRIERIKEKLTQQDESLAHLNVHSSDTRFITPARAFLTRLSEGEKKLPENEISDLQNYISAIAQRACDRASQAFDHNEAALGQYKGIDISVKGYIPKTVSDFKAYPEFLFSINGQRLEVIDDFQVKPLKVVYNATDSLTVKGLFTRIDNALNNFDEGSYRFRQLLTSLEEERESLNEEQRTEYPHLRQLEQLRRDSVEVMAELRKSQEDPSFVSSWVAISLSQSESENNEVVSNTQARSDDLGNTLTKTVTDNEVTLMASNKNKKVESPINVGPNPASAKVDVNAVMHQHWLDKFQGELKKLKQAQESLKSGFDINVFENTLDAYNQITVIEKVLTTNFPPTSIDYNAELVDAVEGLDLDFIKFLEENTQKLAENSAYNAESQALNNSDKLLNSNYSKALRHRWGERFDSKFLANEQAKEVYSENLHKRAVTAQLEFGALSSEDALNLASKIVEADLNYKWKLVTGNETLISTNSLKEAFTEMRKHDREAIIISATNEVVARTVGAQSPGEDSPTILLSESYPLHEAIEDKKIDMPDFSELQLSEQKLAQLLFMVSHYDGEVSSELSREINELAQETYGEKLGGVNSGSIPASWRGNASVSPRVVHFDESGDISRDSLPQNDEVANIWIVELQDGTNPDDQWQWFATRHSEESATELLKNLQKLAAAAYEEISQEKQNGHPLAQLEQDALLKAHNDLSQRVPTEEQTDPVLSNQITYLNIPYIERKEAASVAGKMKSGENWLGFDEKLKLWFAKPGADLTVLKKWLPDESITITDTQDVEQEFSEILKDNGFILSGPPVMDGTKQRVKTEGDKNGQQSGVYCAFTDGKPAGWYINFKKHTEHQKWVSGNVVIDPTERANLRAIAAQTLQNREAETRSRYDDMAKWVSNFVAKLKEVGTHGHDYLKRKLVPATTGVKIDNSGNLIIPLQNASGKITSMQSITPEGIKTLKKDAEMAGSFFIVGDDGKGFENASQILYAEGYSTSASVHLATGKPVVMCVSASNIPNVAAQLYAQYPNANHCFFADDDHSTEHNAGITKASQARDITNGKLFIPVFTQEERGLGWTDFSDIHVNRGLNDLRDMIGYLEDANGVSWGLSNALTAQIHPGYPLAENDGGELEYAAAASLFDDYLMGEDNGDAVRLAAKHAAESGSAAGHFILASCYTDGIGTVPDMAKAYEHLTLAEEMGSADASYRLGEIYEYGIEGQPQDLRQARKHYALAAQNPELKKLASAAVSRMDKHRSAPMDWDDLKMQRNQTVAEMQKLNAEIEALSQHEKSALERAFILGNGSTITCKGDQSHDMNLRQHLRVCMSEANRERVALSGSEATKEVGTYRGLDLVVKSEEGKFTFGLVTTQGAQYEPEELVFQKGKRETFNLGEIIGAIDKFVDEHKILTHSRVQLQAAVNQLSTELDKIDKLLHSNQPAPSPSPRSASSPSNHP